jgi:AcrR family transcriptional regulator
VIAAYPREGVMLDMAANRSEVMTPRGRATHARIVGAAADLIYRRGLRNTTLNDVRAAAGVSGSQVTHYFEDRRALVRGVIAWRRDQLLSLHTQGELARLDSFQALQDWADINVQFQVDNDCFGGCIFGSLVGELLRSDEDIRADLVAVYVIWRGCWSQPSKAVRSSPRCLARSSRCRMRSTLLFNTSARLPPSPSRSPGGGSRAVGEGTESLTAP